MHKRLIEKIEKGRKLVEEFNAIGVNCVLDEKIGEVSFTFVDAMNAKLPEKIAVKKPEF